MKTPPTVRPQKSARRISFEASLAFKRLHEETYRAFGYELVEIPLLPLVDRAALIDALAVRFDS